ncbi:unnamed protein product, partial [Effrenium voratum]
MEQLLEDVVWAYRSDPPPETVLSLSKDQFAAGKYVVEYKLFHWVLTQNRCHGVAPSRTQLMEKAQAFVPSNVNSAVRSQLCKLFGGKPRAQRKWLARFRKRWGVRLGVLKVQDYVPVEEKRAKALAFFKRVNHAVSQAPDGRRPLLINMDETSLAYHIGGLRGAVVQGLPKPAAHASLSELRGHVSYLASVADDAAVQPSLPQVLIGNNRRLTPQVLRAFELTRPQNIFVWRCKTAWNTHANMRRYICLLLRSLGDQLRSRHVNTVAWLEVICQTIQEVMPRSWQQAFQADGVVSHQRLMSAHLCRDLGLQQPPLLSAAPPTEQEFRQVMPRRARLSYDSYVLWGKTARAAKAAAAPVP